MRTTALLGAILALLPVASAWGQTIEDALAKTYETNPTLAAERAQLRVADEGLPQALAQRRPTVTGTGDVGLGVRSTNKPSNQTLYPRDAQLALTQPLWTGGRADAAISQADYLVRAERANLINTEESVLLQTATAYLDAVRDQSVLDRATNNVTVLKKALDQAEAQLAAGIATRTDVAQADARLAQGLADLRQAEANLTNSRAAYLLAVGNMPGTLTAAPPVQNLPPSEDSAVRQAGERNPRVVSAQANEQAARAGIDLAAAQLMPSLAANGQLIHTEDQTTKGERIDSAQALLTLTVPIYQGGGEYSKVRAAKEAYGQRQNEIEVAVRSAELNSTIAWENLKAARANIESFQSQINANQIAYDGVVEQNRVGTRTFLDILNAQQELFKSQVNLVGAQHDEALSAYQLKSAVGDLTASALHLPVEHYDPGLHYGEVRDKWIGVGPVLP